MPRAVNIQAEAKQQGVFLADPGNGRIVQPIVVYRRDGLRFSSAAALITFPAVVVGKYYRIVYRSFATAGGGIRIVSGTERVHLDAVAGERGLWYGASFYASSTSLAMEADAAVYTGALTDIVLYEIPAPVSLSQPNMLLYPEYYSAFYNVPVSGSGRALPSSAAQILTFPTTMVPGNNYTVSFRTTKSAGAEIRVSNNGVDGVNVVFTTSGLPTGETLTTTTSFTASSSRMITLGASGSVFSGQVWDISVA